MIEKHNLDIDIHSKLSYTGDNAEGGIDNMVNLFKLLKLFNRKLIIIFVF